MGLEMSYRRVTLDRLLPALDDRRVARDLMYELPPRNQRLLAGTPNQPHPADARELHIGKTWDSIRHLLEQADGPVEITRGTSFEPYLEGAAYLADDHVRQAADWLTDVTFDDLVGSIDPTNPSRAIFYRANPSRQRSVAWVRECYDALVPFFAAAARHDEAMLILWC